MNHDVTPIKPYVTPTFGGAIVGVFVIAAIIWAAVSPIRSAIMAPGLVRVEANRKVIRHREGGTVRAIPVREGQHVAAGQPVLILDDVQPKAAVDVLQNQVRWIEVEPEVLGRYLAEHLAPHGRARRQVLAAGPFVGAEEHRAILDADLDVRGLGVTNESGPQGTERRPIVLN